MIIASFTTDYFDPSEAYSTSGNTIILLLISTFLIFAVLSLFKQTRIFAVGVFFLLGILVAPLVYTSYYGNKLETMQEDRITSTWKKAEEHYSITHLEYRDNNDVGENDLCYKDEGIRRSDVQFVDKDGTFHEGQMVYIPQDNNCKVELYKNGALNSYEPMET